MVKRKNELKRAFYNFNSNGTLLAGLTNNSVEPPGCLATKLHVMAVLTFFFLGVSFFFSSGLGFDIIADGLPYLGFPKPDATKATRF